MSYARRTDGPHAAIRTRLRELGWFVRDTSAAGKGFPDLAIAKGGKLYLVEVKDGAKAPSDQALTVAEGVVHRGFDAVGVPVVLLRSVIEAELFNAGLI